MRSLCLACGFLLASGLTPAPAQVTFELAASPEASLLINDLLKDFSRADPSLLSVMSSGVDNASLTDSLTRGFVDIAFAADSPELRQALDGMVIAKVATVRGQMAGTASPIVGHFEIVAVFPASPSPDVRQFLNFISSSRAQATLRQHGAELAR
jgi:ABC-type molybdate transport system substrate-binding protein